MLPILATIGSALLWFVTTMGQLVIWGAGLGLGIWAIKRVTNVWDQWLLNRKALQLGKDEYGITDEAVVLSTAPVY